MNRSDILQEPADDRPGSRVAGSTDMGSGSRGRGNLRRVTAVQGGYGQIPNRPHLRDDSLIEERAVRLLSETAHDLRSPLTTVRESIRLVADGHLGTLNEEQRELLAAAIDQCDCIHQMVGEMVQLERLRTGLPKICRRWTAVGEIRRGVEETLRPWVLPRRIELLWDSIDESTLVFADPTMLRRLLVNLITNAVRVTREGQTVLVRLQLVGDREAVSWSVIDAGAGIESARLLRMDRGQTTSPGGEGLGLAISRQIAALHFSPLRIRSGAGVGTEVSFETAVSGPTSVAECWSRWRRSQPLRRPKLAPGTAATPGVLAPRGDAPRTTIELAHEGPLPRLRDRLVAGTVTLGAAMPRSTADRFDEILQNQLRMYDLVYRVDPRHWVWLFDTDLQDLADRLAAIEAAAGQSISQLRVHWGAPQIIPIDDRRMSHRIADLLVRQTLSVSSHANGVDTNEVRLGTGPLEQSPIPAIRLDQEVRRLAVRLAEQSRVLREQAGRLRPGVRPQNS